MFVAEDNEVRYHCHIARKYRGFAHWICNMNLILTKKIIVIFHNLSGYDSHLIMQEISKFDVKINLVPNGLEKSMAFTINNNLVFIGSMQFMNPSLNALVKNFSDDDFFGLSWDAMLKMTEIELELTSGIDMYLIVAKRNKRRYFLHF